MGTIGIIKGPNSFGKWEFWADDGRKIELSSGSCLSLFDAKSNIYHPTRIEFRHDEKRYYAIEYDHLFVKNNGAKMKL